MTSAATYVFVVLSLLGAVTSASVTTSQEAIAQPSKPNQIQWCIDVVLYDFDGIGILNLTGCAETKKDCHNDRERELAQIRTISVSECYKQMIDKPRTAE